MSRSQKVVLLVLALIALVFVGIVVKGQRSANCDGGDADCAKGYAPGGAMQFFAGLVVGASPKARLPQARYVLQGQPPLRVDIAAANDKIRTLKVRLTQGTANLSVANRPDANGDTDFPDEAKPTMLPRDAADKDDRRTLSFAVTKGGAVLTVACTAGPCIVEGG